jgi:hypothetical protein
VRRSRFDARRLTAASINHNVLPVALEALEFYPLEEFAKPG